MESNLCNSLNLYLWNYDNFSCKKFIRASSLIFISWNYVNFKFQSISDLKYSNEENLQNHFSFQKIKFTTKEKAKKKILSS